MNQKALVLSAATLLALLGVIGLYLVATSGIPGSNPGTTVTTPTPNTPVSGSSGSTAQGLQFCPDEWIVNKMPTVISTSSATSSAPARDYYIYLGARREISEFDAVWVKANCSLAPQEVF